MRVCQSEREDFERRALVVCRARPGVHAVGDGIEFVLRVDRQVSALGQALAQQAVGVLAGGSLS